jgi:MYXO-CTERM domain-containing protein
VKEELMLTRSLLIASAAVIALSLMTAVAAAKEVKSAMVCGPTDCVSVDDDQRSEALVMGGSPSDPPPKAEAWYRVRLVIGGEGAHDAFTINVLPKSGYIRSRDQFGGSEWSAMSAQQQASYRRLTAEIDPFPAERLTGISNPKLPAANPAAPAPAQPADEDEGSSATPWLIAAGALAALAGAALVRHIRRRSAPAATA